MNIRQLFFDFSITKLFRCLNFGFGLLRSFLLFFRVLFNFCSNCFIIKLLGSLKRLLLGFEFLNASNQLVLLWRDDLLAGLHHEDEIFRQFEDVVRACSQLSLIIEEVFEVMQLDRFNCLSLLGIFHDVGEEWVVETIWFARCFLFDNCVLRAGQLINYRDLRSRNWEIQIVRVFSILCINLLWKLEYVRQETFLRFPQIRLNLAKISNFLPLCNFVHG